MPLFCERQCATAIAVFKNQAPHEVLLCGSDQEVGTVVKLQEIVSTVPGHQPAESYQPGTDVKYCHHKGAFYAKSCSDFRPLGSPVVKEPVQQEA